MAPIFKLSCSANQMQACNRRHPLERIQANVPLNQMRRLATRSRVSAREHYERRVSTRCILKRRTSPASTGEAIDGTRTIPIAPVSCNAMMGTVSRKVASAICRSLAPNILSLMLPTTRRGV